MYKWERKLSVMRAFGRLPRGDRLVDWLRYRFGGIRKHNLDTRWYSVTEMLSMVRRANVGIEGARLVELGSGWYPLLAVMFHGLGAATIRLTDISRHIRGEFVEKTIHYLIKRSGEVSSLTGIPADTLEKRWRKLLPQGHPWEEVFAAHGMTYDAPLDFAHSGWQAGSLDMIFSNSCLVYVPESALREIFAETRRLLRPGGFFAHNLDPVNVLNGTIDFLELSREEWERIGCCNLHYQNRLRPKRYVQLATEAGLEVEIQDRIPCPEPAPAWDRAGLHADFRDLPESELLCFHFLLAGRNPSKQLAPQQVESLLGGGELKGLPVVGVTELPNGR
jgi:SAM-dependent methyltransferase